MALAGLVLPAEFTQSFADWVLKALLVFLVSLGFGLGFNILAVVVPGNLGHRLASEIGLGVAVASATLFAAIEHELAHLVFETHLQSLNSGVGHRLHVSLSLHCLFKSSFVLKSFIGSTLRFS